MGKELKFIHITKTAGSSIESIAKENNLKWGVHDNEFILANLKDHKRVNKSYVNFDDEYNGTSWHTPTIYYKENTFKDYTTFTIVRNPYTRCISEMYCPWSQMLFFKGEKITSKEQFNDKLRYLMLNTNTDHFHNQSDYVYNGDVKIIDHVLKFENIEEDFNNLMVEYDYDVRLDRHIMPGPPKWDNLISDKYTISDLERKTIDTINHVYRDDFKNFNYKTI